MKTLLYGELPPSAIPLKERELCRRLSSPDARGAEVDAAEGEVRAAVNCRYTAARSEVTYPEAGTVTLGELSLPSRDLYKNLFPCREALLLTVTLGYAVERLLTRLSVVSVSRHFTADAVASALIESAADEAEARLLGDSVRRPRFSVGYGDLSLSHQAAFLTATDAYRRLGVTLTEGNLLSPQKTITAIVGILP